MGFHLVVILFVMSIAIAALVVAAAAFAELMTP
jgi:hypothetical protein